MTDEQLQPELLKYHLVAFQILCLVLSLLLSSSLYGVMSNCKIISIVTQTLCCFNDHEGCVVVRIFVQWSAEVNLGVTTLLRDGSSVSLSFVFSGTGAGQN